MQLVVPSTTFFSPLLTVAASFMGVNAKVKINEEWTEPAILWNVIAARKGEKKTAAMKRLLNSVEVSSFRLAGYYSYTRAPDNIGYSYK